MRVAINNINSKPGSITRYQLQKLILTGKERGLVRGTDLSGLREACGTVSLRGLSRLEASQCIARISGQSLPHAPGKAPRTRRRSLPGILPMIDAALIQQIERLGLQHFGDEDHFRNWLEKNFKVRDVRQLASARSAGEVIHVLKQMLDRSTKPAVAGSTATVRERPLSSEAT